MRCPDLEEAQRVCHVQCRGVYRDLTGRLSKLGLGPSLCAAFESAEGVRALAARPGPGEPYGRRAILRSETAEVLLVTWAEDHVCAPHDHGGARGTLYLYQGSFVERAYRFDGASLSTVAERRWNAPQIVEIDGPLIHDMRAIGGGLGVHVYEPGVKTMRVYDMHRRETLIVNEDAGAWIPSDERVILDRTRW